MQGQEENPNSESGLTKLRLWPLAINRYQESYQGELLLLLSGIIRETNWSSEQRELLQQIKADFKTDQTQVANKHGFVTEPTQLATGDLNRFLRVASADLEPMINRYMARIESLMTPDQLADAENRLKAVVAGRRQISPPTKKSKRRR